MTTARFPNLLPESIELLTVVRDGNEVTLLLIEAMLDGRRGASSPALIMADLDRAHMIDDHQIVTPLGASVGRMWRQHLTKERVLP